MVRPFFNDSQKRICCPKAVINSIDSHAINQQTRSRTRKKMRSALSTILTAIVISFQASCTLAPQKPPVPGLPAVSPISNEFIEHKELSTVTVLMALKEQLREAIAEIEDERAKHLGQNNPFASSFTLKKGTGVFTGATKVVQTDEGKLSVVIPFSGYDDTTATPSFERTATTTGEYTTVLNFDIDPSLQDNEKLPKEVLKDVDVGDFIKDALLAVFNDAMNMPRGANPRGFSPVFTISKVSINASFVIVRKGKGGAAFTLVPTGDIASIDPSLAATAERTGTYKIEVSFPLKTTDTGDDRRMINSWPTSGGGYLSLEKQYEEEDFIASLVSSGYAVLKCQNKNGKLKLFVVRLPDDTKTIPDSVRKRLQQEGFEILDEYPKPDPDTGIQVQDFQMLSTENDPTKPNEPDFDILILEAVPPGF